MSAASRLALRRRQTVLRIKSLEDEGMVSRASVTNLQMIACAKTYIQMLNIKSPAGGKDVVAVLAKHRTKQSRTFVKLASPWSWLEGFCMHPNVIIGMDS
jgi:hypothetical protein